MDDIAKMFLNEHLSDVHFIVGPDRTRYPGHRAILAARCPKLGGLLSGHFEDSAAAEIELPNVNSTNFKYILEFIYTDNVRHSLSITTTHAAFFF